MNWKYQLDIFISVFGTYVSYLLGGFDYLIKALFVLMVLDYLSGIISAYKNKAINSETGFIGIIKKFCMIMVIIASVLLDLLVSKGSFIFRNMVILFYISNECLSLIENIGNIGVPIPIKLKEAFEQLKKDDVQS